MTFYLVYLCVFISIGFSCFSLGYSLGTRSQMDKDEQKNEDEKNHYE